MILPSVLPATHLRASRGFHRFEPVEWVGIAPAPGNVTYPTRNFARIVLQVSLEAGLYLDLHDSSERRFGAPLPNPPLSDGVPPPSGGARDGISRSPRASS